MRFYTRQHRHYCGVDLHARTMYICVLNEAGEVLVHRNLPCSREHFLAAVASCREDLVVAVECLFCWYGLADLCAEEGIAFVLGHALYMKAVHGGKSKNDRLDSYKIAALLRGGGHGAEVFFEAFEVYQRRIGRESTLARRCWKAGRCWRASSSNSSPAGTSNCGRPS